jgi:hypothetical protein
VPGLTTIVPHDDLAHLQQRLYAQTMSHNGLASSRLPASEAQAWYKRITSAFGTVYYNNAGGKRGAPYASETMPAPYAVLIRGAQSQWPKNVGAVQAGYQTASSGLSELYGLEIPVGE